MVLNNGTWQLIARLYFDRGFNYVISDFDFEGSVCVYYDDDAGDWCMDCEDTPGFFFRLDSWGEIDATFADWCKFPGSLVALNEAEQARVESILSDYDIGDTISDHLNRRQPQPTTDSSNSDNTTNEENTMTNKVKTAISNAAEKNKDSVILAAQIKVGTATNKVLTKVYKDKLPMMLRPYADNPMFQLLVANALALTAESTGIGGKRGQVYIDAMVTAAHVELQRMIPLEELLLGAMDKVVGTSVDTLMDEAGVDKIEV